MKSVRLLTMNELSPMSMAELMLYAKIPLSNQIVRCNGLWEDVMYSYCRSVFGIDYELLFRNNDQNLPPILRDKIIEDIKNILPLLKETYYD